MIKILKTIDSKEILQAYKSIEEGILWTEFGHTGKQAGLQFKLGEDTWTSSVGKRRADEVFYDQLNEFFSGTVFDTIIKEYNLKRTRLMWVNSKSCYSMHHDQNPRIHIPLITDPQCFFIFKRGFIINLAVNNVYWVDTREPHTFANCSDFNRLHLVGSVVA